MITAKQVMALSVLSMLYLFAFQKGEAYSRIVFGLTAILYLFISYVVREIRKYMLRNKIRERDQTALLIVTAAGIADSVISNLNNHIYAGYRLVGIVLMDKDLTGQKIQGIPVVSDGKSVPEYVCQQWIDEVLVIPSEEMPYPEELMEQLEKTGITVHMNLAKISNESGRKQFVEKIGNYTVLTTSMNYASASALLMKRLMDIVGGLLGCILTMVIFLFVAPVIYISSPGPIFFSQIRVGKNGKKFKMYKFRSMYLDAEERKAELMKENKMSNNLMFKMDFDPRIIGNKILPDGTKKTGIGQFIRSTSLDEFPQFLNVIRGELSVVGFRPCLESEFSEYSFHHRSRISMKPGITGMWQVSGRSDITDFEEVVRLDTEYIRNWSMGLDFRILLKTVKTVLHRDGSM